MPVPQPIDEKALLLQLRSGDQRAFEVLYRSYGPRIYSRLLRLVKQETLAEELLQDVFMRIWDKRATIDPERSFRSWLYRIAENLVTDLFRRAAYDKKLLAELIKTTTELDRGTEQQLDYKEGNARLQQAIAALPPQRRKVYTLCKVEGKSYEEVSRLLGISTSTISDHIVKASRSIRTQFSAGEMALIAIAAAYILG